MGPSEREHHITLRGMRIEWLSRVCYRVAARAALVSRPMKT